MTELPALNGSITALATFLQSSRTLEKCVEIDKLGLLRICLDLIVFAYFVVELARDCCCLLCRLSCLSDDDDDNDTDIYIMMQCLCVCHKK